MGTEIITMPLSQGGKLHQLIKVRRGSKEMWVDLTVLRKKTKSFDNVPVFTLEDGKLIYNHFEKVNNLLFQGLY